MKIVDTLIDASSLGNTLNNINFAVLTGRLGKMPGALRREAAEWIAARHFEPGGYADTFALLPQEKSIIRVFTGEKMTCASAHHIAGEEACAALLKLGVSSRNIKKALSEASDGLWSRLGRYNKKTPDTQPGGGWYCCCKCSVSLWRHLIAGGLDNAEQRLADGMRILKAKRTLDGKWQTFPFYYTLATLLEIHSPQAGEELSHAAPTCEKLLKRYSKPADQFATCRKLVLEKVLEVA